MIWLCKVTLTVVRALHNGSISVWWTSRKEPPSRSTSRIYTKMTLCTLKAWNLLSTQQKPIHLKVNLGVDVATTSIISAMETQWNVIMSLQMQISVSITRVRNMARRQSLYPHWPSLAHSSMTRTPCSLRISLLTLIQCSWIISTKYLLDILNARSIWG